jgi:5-deoxy-glucuronate isomerase
MSDRWWHPRGSLARDGWDLVVDGALEGWRHTGLRVHDLAAGPAPELPAADVERMVVPLTGDLRVAWAAGGERGVVELAGRPSVVAGPADTASFGPGTALALTGTGRVGVAEAAAAAPRPLAVLRAADTPVEHRGAGVASRIVHNFGVPGALPAERLIVCEVITPAGNWSSYPPHKHDEATATESRLEEIYYFESELERGRVAPDADPFGMFAAYSSAAGEIDLARLVRTGDVALIPYGYHGPAAAAPGYDLYYLNVMAGPDPERAWRISDDPRHAWVRGAWADDERTAR